MGDLPLIKAALRAVPGACLVLRTFRRSKTRLRNGSYWAQEVKAAQYWHIWMKHLSLVLIAGMPELPRDVVEFGPGDSLGVGLSALFSGARRYCAFDADHFSIAHRDAAMAPQILALAQAVALPPPGGWPDLQPHAAALKPWRAVVARAAAAWQIERLDTLKEAVSHSVAAEYVPHATEPIRVIAPWQPHADRFTSEFDLVMSHSVLQYVADVPAFFQACRALLRPGGWMSHQIDFRSMGITKMSNGHLRYGDRTWRFLTSRRKFHPNRRLLSEHLEALDRAGFDVVVVHRKADPAALPARKLAPRFRSRSNEDVRWTDAFVVARKRAAA